MTALNRARETAKGTAQKARQSIHQGQAKIDAIQARRQADALLRRLGRAYYDERRRAGRHDDVEAALIAVDIHAAETGSVDTSEKKISGGSVRR